jgi:hypothetical protein
MAHNNLSASEGARSRGRWLTAAPLAFFVGARLVVRLWGSVRDVRSTLSGTGSRSR